MAAAAAATELEQFEQIALDFSRREPLIPPVEDVDPDDVAYLHRSHWERLFLAALDFDRYPDITPLGEIRLRLAQNLRRGMACPACSRRVALQPRTLNQGMADALERMYGTYGLEWGNKPKALKGLGPYARDDSYLRFWGLMEPMPAEALLKIGDKEAGRGMWRVTPQGERFLRGKIKVPAKAMTFAARCFEMRGDLISFTEAAKRPVDVPEITGRS